MTARDPRGPMETPGDLTRALGADPVAAGAWESLAASHRREYLAWIEEAKRPETRARRIARTLEMLSSGDAPR